MSDPKNLGPYYIGEKLFPDSKSIHAWYRAHDTRPLRAQQYALCLVGDNVSSLAGFVEQFQEDMQRSLRLQGPAILRLRDFGTRSVSDSEKKNGDNSEQIADTNKVHLYCYLVTDEFSGVTLKDLLARLSNNKQVLRPSDGLELVRQLAEAAEYIRINDVFSRSLDSTKILLRPTPPQDEFPCQVTFLDFGLEQIERLLNPSVTTASEPTVVESPIAQEDTKQSSKTKVSEVGNPKKLKPGDEVYQLGLLLHELLLGVSFSKNQAPPRAHFPALPGRIELLIQTALAQTVTERYDTPGLLAAAIARIIPESRYIEGWPTGKSLIDLASVLPGIDESIGKADDVKIIAVPAGIVIGPGSRESIEVVVRNNSGTDHTTYLGVKGTIPQEWYTIDHREGILLDPKDAAKVQGKFQIHFHIPEGRVLPVAHYVIQLQLFYKSGSKDILTDQKPFDISIKRVRQWEAELWPRVIKAGQPGQIVIENQGNDNETFDISLIDDEGQLIYEVEQKAIHTASLLLDAGDTGIIEFRAWPLQTHWSGKQRSFPVKVNILAKGDPTPQTGLKQLDGRILSRRLIPPWQILIVVLCLLTLIIGLISSLFPKITNAKPCPEPKSPNEAQISICVESYAHVDSLILNPGERILDPKSKRIEIAAPAPNEPINQVELIGRNEPWSSFIPFFKDTEYVSVPVSKPQPTLEPMPTPAPVAATPLLEQFCIRAAQWEKSICTDSTNNIPTVSLLRFETEKLQLQWSGQNLEAAKLLLVPEPSEPLEPAAKKLFISVPANDLTYKLILLNASDTPQTVLTINLKVEEITCTVNTPEMFMRKSPGVDYETIATLKSGVKLLLRTKPIDYQQNSDPYHWVQVFVVESGEEGWVSYSPEWLSCAYSKGDAVDTVLYRLPTPVPPFGPTLTPIPTETPTPTLTPPPIPTDTPMPSPTTKPTDVPLKIEITLDKTTAKIGEVVTVEWNIEGVKEVYYDKGPGPQPIYDNRMRSDTVKIDNTDSDSVNTKTLRWRIVLMDGSERIVERKIVVSQP